MTRDMTTRNLHSNTFQPMVGQDSQDWGGSAELWWRLLGRKYSEL